MPIEAIAKTRKLGGSLIVTIPKMIVESEGLSENQMIRVHIQKIKKSGFGLCRGVGPFIKEGKLRGQLER